MFNSLDEDIQRFTFRHGLDFIKNMLNVCVESNIISLSSVKRPQLPSQFTVQNRDLVFTNSLFLNFMDFFRRYMVLHGPAHLSGCPWLSLEKRQSKSASVFYPDNSMPDKMMTLTASLR